MYSKEDVLRYFRGAGISPKIIEDRGSKIVIEVPFRGMPMKVTYDGYMATLIYYAYRVYNSNIGDVQNRLNNLYYKFKEYKVDINMEKYNGNYHVYLVYGCLSNNDPFNDLNKLIQGFDNAYSRILGDLQQLENYL